MSMLRKGEEILYSSEAIEQHVISYYSDIFASPNSYVPNSIINYVILAIVSREDNIMLTNVTTMDDVKKAVFALNGEGAPGPDGFGGCFYQTYWDPISKDLFMQFINSLSKVGFYQILTQT